jgi:SAM-dependent methyltransferase
VPSSDSGATGHRAYVLGHSEREISRLKAQARLVDPTTRRFFDEAGLGQGMRVLDVGSGAGDVAMLAAAMVGDAGEVVGVDRAGTVLEVARARAAEQSLRQVTFIEGDPTTMEFDRPFDAVIGRYVLQFQKDPAAMLKQLSRMVKPGGLIVFHEIDWTGLKSVPTMPVFEQCGRWGMETLRRHGTEMAMGTRLHAAFMGAGLGAPRMRLEARVGGAPTILPWLRSFADLLGVLAPEMERLGVATAKELDIETLADRLCAEAASLGSLVISHYQVGAWIRV